MKNKLIYGFMGHGGGWDQEEVTEKAVVETQKMIRKCMEMGINYFDHADIYQLSKSETCFGEAIKRMKLPRDQYILQTKSGINLTKEITSYNNTGDYIRKSLEASLKRLKTDYVDYFLIHRPDPLMDIASLKSSLHDMKSKGLFKHLGVSNMNHHQIDYLSHALDMPIVVNQLEMSLLKHGFVERTILVNHLGYHDVDFPEGTLEYCMKHHIDLQAWGSSAQGIFSRDNEANENIKNTREYLKELGVEKSTNVDTLVLKWLMTHPAGISPIIGTSNENRLDLLKDIHEIELDRSQWYTILHHIRGLQIP